MSTLQNNITYDPSNYRVVIADDLLENRELLRKTLEPKGFDAFMVPSGELAIQVTSKVKPDLILLDIRMPGMGGFETARILKRDKKTAGIPIIFITVDDDLDSLVKAFDVGAVDYIIKPFKEKEVLARTKTHVELYRLRIALETEISRREKAETERESARKALSEAGKKLSFFTQREAKRWGIEGFIGRSKALSEVVDQIRKVQPSDSISVIITGESGAGKELIARAIHFGGPRATGPFVPINCSAIPKDLAESLLFGHVKGSFSGAVKDQKGYFEMAEGGTLFLDELGELPLNIQAKLLRVLEDNKFMQVGGSASIRTNVRIISATHRDLRNEVEAGTFRQDLYYRMARFSIHVPPLRERLEDIALLASHFLEQFASEMGKIPPKLSDDAAMKLMAYDYPGNIRELKNLMERATIESMGDWIEAKDIFLPSQAATNSNQKESNARSKDMSLHALGDEEQAILKYVRDHQRISNSQSRALLDVSLHRASYLLNKLTKAGHLHKAGANRNAVYIQGDKGAV